MNGLRSKLRTYFFFLPPAFFFAGAFFLLFPAFVTIGPPSISLEAFNYPCSLFPSDNLHLQPPTTSFTDQL